MKKLLTLTLALLFLLGASQLKAQVRFGPEVGLNLSEMTLKSSGTSLNTSTLITFHAGFDVEFHLVESLFLQSGVLYSVKGTKITSTNGNEEQLNPNYIEIPVHLMIKFNIGKPKLLFLVGPYFEYGISGKIKAGGNSRDIRFGNNDPSDMKPFDLGLNMGLGFEISGVQITGKYCLGLTELSPYSNHTIKNGVIEISLAYLIGKK